jgi:hypothetical protein
MVWCQESKAYVSDLVINEEYLLEALCYDLAVEHPQAILIQGHRAFQQVRRKSTARNIVNRNNNNSTPTGSTEGNRTPASLQGQGGRTPGSALGLGEKTPGSALGSVMDMDMDSPLPRGASFIGDRPSNSHGTGEGGGGGQKEDGQLDEDAPLSEEEAEEVLLDLATEILMATWVALTSVRSRLVWESIQLFSSSVGINSITTPLTVLSKPHIIAASTYILAISMMKDQTVHDSLRALDVGTWEEVFLPQDGIRPIKSRDDQFQAEIRGESQRKLGFSCPWWGADWGFPLGGVR